MMVLSEMGKNQEEIGLGGHFSLNVLGFRYLSNFNWRLQAVGHINVKL